MRFKTFNKTDDDAMDQVRYDAIYFKCLKVHSDIILRRQMLFQKVHTDSR